MYATTYLSYYLTQTSFTNKGDSKQHLKEFTKTPKKFELEDRASFSQDQFFFKGGA